ncbi:hypothetical protein TREES_T100021482 [Tupaia chinensis]|uniref:Uncharacterized protein n=1 Tax=Tupaia chinensis TaxID=246437 RepID=L9KMF0_TUPCH|nr:hypothetical protein TREES_T100021482 [Tupaia chinensis]
MPVIGCPPKFCSRGPGYHVLLNLSIYCCQTRTDSVHACDRLPTKVLLQRAWVSRVTQPQHLLLPDENSVDTTSSAYSREHGNSSMRPIDCPRVDMGNHVFEGGHTHSARKGH